ncbi:MAG TPA: EpsI family protein [Vicinamibacterales bacterium]|nr:EpsI family protein [Vicinamibacterales bacterium]
MTRLLVGPGGSTLTRAIVLCLMLGATTVFLANARRTETPAVRTTFDSFPMTLDTWRATVDPPMEEDILKVLGVDDYLSRIYWRPDGAAVGLYIGYYGSQRQGDTIHSPLNCLPGAGWEAVHEGRLQINDIDPSGRDIIVNRYIVQKGLERQLVLYWYQSHGRVTASEYSSKMYLIHDAIRLNRTDGSMVRVIAPILPGDDGASAEKLAESFVRLLFPALPSYLPN